MTDDGTSIPARPASDRKHKKYKKIDDDNTSALLSVAPGTSSQHADTAVTKVLHKVIGAAGGSSKKKEVAIDIGPKLKDEAAGQDATTSMEMSIGDKSDSKSISSAVMSATKKTLSLAIATSTKKVTTVVSPKNRSKESDNGKNKEFVRESPLSMDGIEDHKEADNLHDSQGESVDVTNKNADASTVQMTNLRRQGSQAQTQVSEKKSTAMIYMGPVSAFFLHDATIAAGLSLVIAAYPTISNYHLIVENQIPLSVTFAWILIAFTAGYELALLRAPHIKTAEYRPVSPDSVFTIPCEIAIPAPQIETKQGYSVLRRVSMTFPNIKVSFPGEKTIKEAFSSLDTGGKLKAWQRKAHDPVNERLHTRLLRNPVYRRRALAVTPEQAPTESPTKAALTKMGGFDLPEAYSLKDMVIDPLFVLRGMDVFMTEHREEGAEDNMSDHPFLIRNGLRDMPSFVVNILTQWANILIYFRMPEWIKDWDDIVEHDDDPDDVKALKKFLNGDDEYRSKRLKMLPSLVDGPMPIRMVAPPKREMTIHCSMLPTKWRTRDACHKNGKYLHPCLELELDVMANKAMRGMSCLVKRYLQGMSIDVAVTIDKPDLQKEDELSACVGMFGIHKIDVLACPKLPERLELGHSLRDDTIRASRLIQSIDPSAITELQSLPEIAELAQEVGA